MTTVSPSALRERLGPPGAGDLGIYIHVPFCRARCRFCALYMERHREDRVQQFLQALDRELRLYACDLGLRESPVHTMYLGGGTPTTLTPPQLVQVLNAVRTWFVVDEDAEVSLEVHPGTVTQDYLDVLRRAGVTRLSVGGQSFDRHELRTLGGRAFGADARQVVRWARSAGFQNISLDLLFGFPGQSVDSWQRTLEDALALSPEHLSCYAYTLEEGSPFHEQALHGNGSEPDPAFQVELEDLAVDSLSARGWQRYEISNYCRPGYACRHNMRYWQVRPWLGLGPSAQSCLNRVRFGNLADVEWYTASLKRGMLPLDEIRCLSSDQVDRERIIWGLRMLSGVAVEPESSTCRRTPSLLQTLYQLREDELVFVEDSGKWRLTDSGIRYADTVALALF